MKEQLQNIKEQALKTIGDCVDVKQLDELRVKYLGKKGELTAILKSMGKLSAEERPVMGQLANDVRQSLEGFIAQKQAQLKSALMEQKLKKETLDRSNLGLLQVGDEVNVERSMMMNGRLDGHIVQGHVDQTATCIDIKDAEGSYYFTFRYAFDKEMAKRGYITVDKGSVTVNGVSLTVCNPTDDTFQVAIIPYTFEHTNFHAFKVGSVVNLEFDIIGKYISRMIQYK